VPVEELRGRLPAALEVDTHGGEAWLGLTAFRVTNSRPRGLLSVPFLSSFLQLNVRTYVTHNGTPGVWFFSIDVSSAFAHAVGRRLFDLPLHRARIILTRSGERVDFALARRGQPAPPVVFDAAYEAVGPSTRPSVDSLQHFLTERYRLYAQIRGRLHHAELHHLPWGLQPARAEIELNTVTPPDLALPKDVLCHFSRQMDTLLWALAPTGD
jgi:uncharacterized protein